MLLLTLIVRALSLSTQLLFLLLLVQRPARATLFPYTTLFRSGGSRTLTDDTKPSRRKAVRTVSRSVQTSDSFDDAPSERSEEHTSELQSQSNLVCRLLLEKKNI